MIVKMQKVYIVSRRAERERLLDVLREAGLIHIQPVSNKLMQDSEITAKINVVSRALQILSTIEPLSIERGNFESESLSAIEIANQVLDIQKRSAELRNRIGLLYRQLEQLKIWGDVTLEQFEELKQAGIEILFFVISADKVAEIEAECVEIVGERGQEKIVAVIDRIGRLKVPEQAKQISLPQQDAPSIRREAHEIELQLKADRDKLARFANFKDELKQALLQLEEQNEYTIALNGGYDTGELFAIQGWIPADIALSVEQILAEKKMEAAIEIIEPTEEDNPPTLIKHPRWVKPIQGLLDILGTLPGYREIDISPFFMIAIPLFAAMLIGDAGYGLIFTIIPLIFYRKLSAIAGKDKINLLLIVGLATVFWGVLSANIFGITPTELARIGGYANVQELQSGNTLVSKIGKSMIKVAPLWNVDDEKLRTLLIKLSLLIGCVHLSLARVVKALSMLPDIRSVSEFGWAVFLWSMLGIIWLLFFGSYEPMPVSVSIIVKGLIAGGILIVLFTAPNKNPIKMIGQGIASSLLPSLSTFSDTMSYIRLMAVGLATYYIASAFNGLGATVAHSSHWLVAIPIILFGHGLNIGLTVVAIFAHGVRLNMLEFSNNVGVQWSGYPFKAFRRLIND